VSKMTRVPSYAAAAAIGLIVLLGIASLVI
jgi:hypothetical protein